MSDLQIVLILLGALIVAGVVPFNWMQEKKMRDDISEEFIVPKKDVLVEDFYMDTDAYIDKELSGLVNKNKTLNSERIEPVISSDRHDAELNSALDGSPEEAVYEIKTARIEPQVPEAELPEMAIKATAQPEAKEALTQEPSVQETSPQLANLISVDDINESQQSPVNNNEVETVNFPKEIHPQIDLTAFIYANKNMDAKKFSESINNISNEIGAPIIAHKLNTDDVWHLDVFNEVDDVNTFKRVACSVQLADRTGPTAKNILHKFQFSIEEMGLNVGAHVEWQGAGDAVQRAVALDEFCMEVDQLVNLHLIEEKLPIHGTKFKGLAEANGFKLNSQGQYSFFDASNTELPEFILVNDDNQPFTEESLRNNVIKRVSFQMEIPKINNCEQAFTRMVVIAQRMANNMGASMVDDNQKVLGDAQLEKIKQQLKVIHAKMLVRGIAPGSKHSLRLFN